MILCFSGTGNSRYAAEFLSMQLHDEIRFINAFLKSGTSGDFQSEKPFVVVCPTYAWRMPRVVRHFLLHSRLAGNREMYFVLSCGMSAGSAGVDAAAFCKQAGLTFRGFAAVRMPENYMAMFDVPAPEQAREQVRAAERKLSELAPFIARREPFPPFSCNLAARLLGGALNALFSRLLISAKPFYASNVCIGCGQCVALCPLNNIQMNGSRPQWGDDCTHCMACIGGCPAAAIEYGRHTRGKRRYFLTEHPGGFS